MTKLIFERHVLDANTFELPPLEVPAADFSETMPEHLIRKTLPFIPAVSEVELIRHFTELSNRAYGVDNGAYPLGSCTMKYNPKINEWASRLPGFTQIHPYQPEETVQGTMQILYDMGKMLG